jgi:hypothetical protein
MKIINIVQISLKREFIIIKSNIESFKNLYPEFKLKFKLICPKKDIKYFKKIENKDVEIISEDNLINKKQFRKIFLSYNSKSNSIIKRRVNWYYSQCLKIIYILKNYKKNNILWESDSILIKKINFFNENKKSSVNYGNLYEFHQPYYNTNKIILKKLPNKFISGLNLFSAITIGENRFIKKKLEQYVPKYKMNIGRWIAHIIAKSILESKIINKSLFADYELLNISKMLRNTKKQKIIKFFRIYLQGALNKNQIKLLKILNYKFITYEYYHRKIEKFTEFIKIRQPWYELTKIIAREEIKLLKKYLKFIFTK